MTIEERAQRYAIEPGAFFQPVINLEKETAYMNGAYDQKKLAEIELENFTKWVLNQMGRSCDARLLIREYRKTK